MPTFFSINDGNFSSGLATVVGDVSAVGTSGFLLTTTYNHAAATTPTVADSIYGVAFQLSAVSGSPTGTVDIILSASNGSSTTASFPVNGLTQKSGLNSIVPANPVGWQVFAFDTPVSFPVGNSMRVGIKTSVSNKVSLIGQALTNLNRSYVTSVLGNPAAGANDVIHIVGSLSSTGLVSKTVNYNVTAPTTYGNFYVHNGGVLNFDPTINIELTLAGAQGLQITPDGTVNIGSSVNPVQADKTHKINLSNSYINVHNGATFNTYGAYKTPYALISSPVAAGVRTYPLTTDVSNWIFNSTVSANADSVVVTPNLTAFGTFDSTNLSARDSNNIITWRTASFSHVSSNYIPSIVNMTRNVQLSGNNTYVRFLDGSVSNLNNTQFRGLRNATYKGLQFCTNSTGSVSLSNCAFNGDGVATMPAFSFDVAKTPTSNVSIKGSNFSGYGATTDIIKLETVSANNFTFTDNIVLSASQNGMLIDRLSSTFVDIKNNFLIGSSQNGLRVSNPYVLGGTIGGIGCLNQRCGTVVAGTTGRANYDGLAGHYNTLEGVNILGTLPQLSSTVFSNITANNNRTVGLELSGNSNNLNSPIRVNINGVVANDNGDAGFEGYAITGNLSSMSLMRNKGAGIKTSIGNRDTTFDGITSIDTQYSSLGILTKTNISNSADSPYGAGIDGSISFNGTSSYISVASNNIVLGSGDFTVEMWIKTTATGLQNSGSRTIFMCGPDSDEEKTIRIYINSQNTPTTGGIVVSDITNVLIAGNTNVANGNWNHICLLRNGSSVRLFVNGVQSGGTITNTVNFDGGATSTTVIGSVNATQGNFSGLISDVRVIVGEAVVPSTSITSPLDLTLNTVFLYQLPYDSTYTYYTNNLASEFYILSGLSYFPVVIKNSKLINNPNNLASRPLYLASTKFEQFYVESSTLSSNYEDIGTSTTRNLLEGSYHFNNCTFGTGILSSVTENYQPEVFLENGFVVMKENGVSNKHYKLLRSGKISLDTTLAYGTNTVSEKLEPTSNTIKLRCGSKMIPVNKNDTYTVGVYVQKSSGYSGSAPRLMLKRNTALGYEDTVLATSVAADATWELLSVNVPAALDQGIFEVYVDCSGAVGSGSVNIDNWSLDLV